MDKAAASHQPPSLRDVPEPQIDVTSQAIVAPMKAGADMACGVFHRNRCFCEASRTLLSANRFTASLSCPTPEFHLPGRHLFAGIGRHHFGHFLLECVCRLWPLDTDLAFDGLVIIPKQGINFSAVFQRRFRTFLEMLTGGLPVHFATAPVEVETLVVPSQGFGHLHWSCGTERFRGFVRSRIATQIRPDGPDLLYISRLLLKRPEQMVDQEGRIEILMRQAGYSIFHPQRHSLEEQCARYRAASHIVGADGSAFHLASFAIESGTTIGLIQRRHRPEVFSALMAQINAFCDVDLVALNALRARDDRTSRGGRAAPIDIDLLEQSLAVSGLI
ncbi:MAG: glycosyltransferase 61 family protein [Pseudomonadota bacterium]